MQGSVSEAQCVLSGKYPKGVRLGDVLEEAGDVLLEKRSPKRRAKRRANNKLSKQTKTPAKPLKRSRHIAQEVRDAIYLRDGGGPLSMQKLGEKGAPCCQLLAGFFMLNARCGA